MVEVTNYLYLTILICLQYLGLQQESFELTVSFPKTEGREQQMPVTVDLIKNEDIENQWLLISPDEKHKLPITVVKDSITFVENGTAQVNKFEDIDFERFNEQQDTIFDKYQKAVATITRKDSIVKFRLLDNRAYEQIIMRIKQ